MAVFLNSISLLSSMKQNKKSVLGKRVKVVSNKWSLAERAAGFVELGRPMEWSKSLLNMMIAMLMAFYVYSVGVNLWIFAAGFFSIAFLWSGLYALNDFTDWKRFPSEKHWGILLIKIRPKRLEEIKQSLSNFLKEKSSRDLKGELFLIFTDRFEEGYGTFVDFTK